MQLKRFVDQVVALIILICCSPIFLLAALLTLFDAGRPIFFKQERIGLAGQPFPMLKFRTMTNDDRREITRSGRFLRRTCLDELPQLLNVIRGDMAIIGPRPALSTEVNLNDPSWQQVLQVRPGIAGLWQVSDNSDASEAARLAADLHYLQHRGWRLNLRIIAKSFKKIFR